jgi:porphobilinogen synthase
VAEGADFLMIKPALPYLDILIQVRASYNLPIAAYQVSGEYAMLHAAAQNGWLDLRRWRGSDRDLLCQRYGALVG